MKQLIVGLVVIAFVAFVVLFDAGPAEPRNQATAAVEVAGTTVQTVCPFTRSKIREHRQATWETQRKLRRTLTRKSDVPVVGCGYARWVENLWWKRSVALAKRARWVVLPDTRDWQTAVLIAQRPFPGTESWLLSCSSAEGGHSGWVIYGGGSYYRGVENAKTFHGDMVGGPMQYMWGTFRGHYRHALDSLRERGFVTTLPHSDDVEAWRSMTAQALAAGWARWSHNDDSHWSASFGNGC